MIDWFVFLSPVLLLPIFLLFAFTGCQLIWPVELPPATLVPVPVTLTIEPGCDIGVTSIQVLFNIGVFFGTEDAVDLEVTPVPPNGVSISTSDLMRDETSDEETLWCKVTIVLEEGDPLTPKQVAHDMIGDAPVEPFVLSCTDGEFNLS
jgi:predicted small lipoprotein YifL